MDLTFSELKFVTSNLNKVREAQEILGITINQVDLEGLVEIQTSDVIELVNHKIQQAYQLIQEPLIVEDSGLFFDAWNELPGALVKWFEKSVGCLGMLKMLSSFDQRNAVALCCVAYHDGQNVEIFQGRVRGVIAEEPLGKNGFGWDAIFIPHGYDKTFAQMNSIEKNIISHRRRALEKFKDSF